MIHSHARWSAVRWFAASQLAWLLASPASALSVDTGPGENYGGGWSLYEDRPATSGYQRLAARFTVDGPDTITSVQGWINWAYGGAITFAVQTDIAGLPGALLHSTTVNLPATALNVPDWRGVGGLNWQLQAGDHWLVFQDRPGGGSGSMPAGSANPLAAYASSPGLLGAEWMTANTLGFGVRINIVPEPPPLPAVPEPAIWLLLLCGALLMPIIARRSIPTA